MSDRLDELPKHCGPIGADRCIYCGRPRTDNDAARCIDTIEAYKRANKRIGSLSPAGVVSYGVKMAPGIPKLPDWLKKHFPEETK